MSAVDQGGEGGGVVAGAAADPVGVLGPGDQRSYGLGVAFAALRGVRPSVAEDRADQAAENI